MEYKIKITNYASFVGMKVERDFKTLDELKNSIEVSLISVSEENEDDDIDWQSDTYKDKTSDVVIDEGSLVYDGDVVTLNVKVTFENEIVVSSDEYDEDELCDEFNNSIYFDTVGSFIIDTGNYCGEIEFDVEELDAD